MSCEEVMIWQKISLALLAILVGVALILCALRGVNVKLEVPPKAGSITVSVGWANDH